MLQTRHFPSSPSLGITPAILYQSEQSQAYRARGRDTDAASQWTHRHSLFLVAQLYLVAVSRQPKNACKLLEVKAVPSTSLLLSSKSRAEIPYLTAMNITTRTLFLAVAPWQGSGSARHLVLEHPSFSTPFCHPLLTYFMARTAQFYFKIYFKSFPFSAPKLMTASPAYITLLLKIFHWHLLSFK